MRVQDCLKLYRIHSDIENDDINGKSSCIINGNR